MGHKEKKIFAGKKPYLLVLGAGVIAGVMLYHLYGKTIDGYWNATPILENYKSHFALSNLGGDAI